MTKDGLKTFYFRTNKKLQFRLHDVSGKFPICTRRILEDVILWSSERPLAGHIYERELHLTRQYFEGELWWVLREGSRFVAFPSGDSPKLDDLLQRILSFLDCKT